MNRATKVNPGDVYDSWKVTGNRVLVNRKTYITCECACGTKRSIRTDALLNGRSKSCGCRTTEQSDAAMHQLRETWTWACMRGIQLDGEWPDWLAFKWWSLRNGFRLGADFILQGESWAWVVARKSLIGPIQQKIKLQ